MNSNWKDQAICRGMDTNFFFPEMSEKGAVKLVRKIKEFCNDCPVRSDCLEDALLHDEAFGMWGGYTPKERKMIKRAQKVTAKSVNIKVNKQNDSSEI